MTHHDVMVLCRIGLAGGALVLALAAADSHRRLAAAEARLGQLEVAQQRQRLLLDTRLWPTPTPIPRPRR